MMQNKVVGIISKPSSSRGDLEVKAVLPWLKKKSELLNGCEDGEYSFISHQENISVQYIPPYTPLLYSKTGIRSGIPIFLFLLQNIG